VPPSGPSCESRALSSSEFILESRISEDTRYAQRRAKRRRVAVAADGCRRGRSRARAKAGRRVQDAPGRVNQLASWGARATVKFAAKSSLRPARRDAGSERDERCRNALSSRARTWRFETGETNERIETSVTIRIELPVGKWPRASTRSNPLDSATPTFAHVHWQLLPPFCIKWGPERVVGENRWSQSPKRESTTSRSKHPSVIVIFGTDRPFASNDNFERNRRRLSKEDIHDIRSGCVVCDCKLRYEVHVECERNKGKSVRCVLCELQRSNAEKGMPYRGRLR